MNVKIIHGNIVECDTDAIVNAANSLLLPGGGVSGAIFKAAGKRKLKKALRGQGPIPAGEAVITEGCDLPAKYIIHTVAPFYKGGNHNERSILYMCYKNIIDIARDYNIKTIAIPCLGTSHYRYPFKEAAEIALDVIMEEGKFLQEIQLICFTYEDYKDYLSIYNDYIAV